MGKLEYTLQEYKDLARENRLRITASNGKIVHGTTEGYIHKKDMRRTSAKVGKTLITVYAKYLRPAEIDEMILELHKLSLKLRRKTE